MVEDFNAALAERIGSARKDAGKTQQQVADALSIHVNQYQRLETGKHRVSVYDLTRIAAAIGIPAGDLLSDPSPQNHLRVSEIIAKIRHQLEINVQIAEDQYPEGPIVDGKRVKGLTHSQDILAQHIRDHLSELELVIVSPAPAPSTHGRVPSIISHVEKYDVKEGDPRRRYTFAQLDTAISLASAPYERIADALELCDWSGCSIGNKAILKEAVRALRGGHDAD